MNAIRDEARADPDQQPREEVVEQNAESDTHDDPADEWGRCNVHVRTQPADQPNSSSFLTPRSAPDDPAGYVSRGRSEEEARVARAASTAATIPNSVPISGSRSVGKGDDRLAYRLTR